jgi:hypothetical protein
MPKLARRSTKPAGGRGEPALFDAATVKLWNSCSSTTARLVRALDNATAKPICEGGLAEYFVSEAHRRAALEGEPGTWPRPSATLALASLPASNRGRGDLADCCPVCLDGGGSFDTEETLKLACNHKFHKRCILGWFAVNAACPCCRVQAVRLEPYRYPARTALRRKILRERLGYIVDWRQVPGKPVACLTCAPRGSFSSAPGGLAPR